MITPVCQRCIYLTNEAERFRKCPTIPIFHRDMLCGNSENARKDHVDGEEYKPFCEEVNRHGECLVYYPKGLEIPTVTFDEETNTLTVYGTNTLVITLDGTLPTNKTELVTEMKTVEVDTGETDDDGEPIKEDKEVCFFEQTLDHTVTVRAACTLDGVLSETVSLSCEIPDVPEITFDKSANTVTVSSYNKVFYTTDGTEPTEESAAYTEPFVLEKNSTVKAVSFARGELSDVVTKDCVTIEPPVITFDPETDTVSISADDKTLFSTDGSDIFDDAEEYTEPFKVEKNTLVKAACLVDGELSEQSELLCRVPTKPEISYDSKTKTVSISSDNTVLYTTDGSDVKKKDSEYTTAFKITETTTVKARSIVDGKMSEQAERECVV